METTEVPVERTCAAIVSDLVQAGARQISQEFSANKEVIGVRFSLEVLPGQIRYFALPVRDEPVYKLLRKQVTYRTDAQTLMDRAKRVAWRQLYRWVQAQLAMIQTGMVEAQEVFLPYMEHESGKTFYQMLKERDQLALPPAGESGEHSSDSLG
jgi:hypothetical protein